jgi:hypothetical protein
MTDTKSAIPSSAELQYIIDLCELRLQLCNRRSATLAVPLSSNRWKNIRRDRVEKQQSEIREIAKKMFDVMKNWDLDLNNPELCAFGNNKMVAKICEYFCDGSFADNEHL